MFMFLLSLSAYGQTIGGLDEAISSSLSYLNDKVPQNSRVLLFNVTSGSPALSNYIINELTAGFVNSSSFIIVDRRNLDLLQKELNFQLSGEVSDETAVAVGKKLGAQSIISGSVMPLGDMFRFQIKSIEVRTAKIQGMKNTNFRQDAPAKDYRGDVITLDFALSEVTGYFRQKIPVDSKIVIYDIDAITPDLSTYIIDSLTANMVNEGAFTVVDRRQLDALQQELKFQHSGEVSSESAQSIGKKLGAQSVISGSIQSFGERYYLHFTALEVQTAIVQGAQNYVIQEDAIMTSLAGKNAAKKQQKAASSAEPWKNKRLYLGLRPGLSLHFYDTKNTPYSGNTAEAALSFDITLQTAYQFNRFFSVQTELMLTADSMNVERKENSYDSFGVLLYTYTTTHSFNSYSLVVPVLAKFHIRPGSFSLSAFGGLYIAPGFGITHKDSFNATENSGSQNLSFGYAAGVSGGYKLGPGVLFADIRWLGDFLKTSTQAVNGDIYKRNILAFSVGYEIGFFNGGEK
jgi:curli biogenesis system outer membrane secretion channel CsgG